MVYCPWDYIWLSIQNRLLRLLSGLLSGSVFLSVCVSVCQSLNWHWLLTVSERWSCRVQMCRRLSGEGSVPVTKHSDMRPVSLLNPRGGRTRTMEDVYLEASKQDTSISYKGVDITYNHKASLHTIIQTWHHVCHIIWSKKSYFINDYHCME